MGMKGSLERYVGTLVLMLFIFFLVEGNEVFSQGTIPSITGIPPNSVIVEATSTSYMLNREYFYKASYVASGRFPMMIVFFNRKTGRNVLAYLAKEMQTIRHNKFFVIGPWGKLGSPDLYVIAFISSAPGLPSQEIIETVRVSSNKKSDLEQDKDTVIVDNSTGVAPEKGSDGFKIRYELNELSNLRHNIMRCTDNSVIWEEKKDKVPKGTRGFDWDSKKASEGCYRALVKATSVAKEGRWDKALSRKFQTLK